MMCVAGEVYGLIIAFGKNKSSGPNSIPVTLLKLLNHENCIQFLISI